MEDQASRENRDEEQTEAVRDRRLLSLGQWPILAGRLPACPFPSRSSASRLRSGWAERCSSCRGGPVVFRTVASRDQAGAAFGEILRRFEIVKQLLSLLLVIGVFVELERSGGLAGHRRSSRDRRDLRRGRDERLPGDGAAAADELLPDEGRLLRRGGPGRSVAEAVRPRCTGGRGGSSRSAGSRRRWPGARLGSAGRSPVLTVTRSVPGLGPPAAVSRGPALADHWRAGRPPHGQRPASARSDRSRASRPWGGRRP